MRIVRCTLAWLALAGCEPLLDLGTDADHSLVHVSSDPDVVSYHLRLSDYPANVVAGTPLAITVSVLDASDQPVNYAGTLHITSSDPLASLPADLAISGGRATAANIVLRTAASQTLTARDVHAASLTGDPARVTVQRADTASLQVTGFPGVASAGQAHALVVQAVDAYGNAASASGTVHFTSTDPQAVVPADVALQGGPATSAPATLFTAGAQAWVARLSGSTPLAGQQNVTVAPAAVSLAASSLTASPTAVHNAASYPSALACTLRDTYGNAIVGTPVTFTGQNVTFAPGTASTAGNGQATSLAHSGNAGLRTLTASFGGQSLSTRVGFYTSCNTPTLSATSVANGNNVSRGQSVAIGDIDGDGDADLAVANYGSNNVSLLINQGGGSFAPGNPNAIPSGNGANAVVLADLDLDGDLDMATADWRGNTLTVFDGLGDGNFVQRASYSTGSQPVALVVADLNGDSRPDLVVTNQGDTTFDVYFAQGKGLKTGLAIDQRVSTNGLAVGDIDNDGDLDLLTASYSSGVLTVLRNDGTGTQYTATQYAVPYAYWVAVGDLNADGNLDAVVPEFAVLGSVNGTVTVQDGNQVAVLLGAGGGTLGAAVTYPVNTRPIEVAVADLDLDGHQDIVVVSNNTRNVGLLLGNGNGTFKAQATAPTTADFGYGLAVGDFSGDGRPDVAVAHDGIPATYSLYVNPCN